MNSTDIQNVLNKLAPIAAIKPVTSTKRQQVSIIDDTSENANMDPMYINRFNMDDDLPDIDDLKSGVLFKLGIQAMESQDLLCVNNVALWLASSTKGGSPIENVLNDDPNSFWQSDGGQPHTIDIYFSRRTDIILLALYFSLASDESYTPKLFKLYVGHSPSDAVFYKSYHIEHLDGWVGLTFRDNRPDNLMKCQFLRLVFPINHENGKDTHLRGVRIYSPQVRRQQETFFPPETNGIGNSSSLQRFTIR
ncbi:similar to Saccharomyces cerevisiae YGL240W DOC1 Processivity factor required for the ubiquitination activity of the anaphase promoting complex (APC) [Maudiozyma saulgeensis]|uniref:Similar to Saccharomyces cerevisiae YGL240W DOC1 Processivity factor required for the ubiquitination activity of the anaphase promoting complex (APC) n=1 Tax=Maudiozyma saulgeensis TaxID=1789683 RepID=A0A1X7QXY0_9SACH|nr:similar to Saccharomyces cerevisiae YGL240W DOC1 Processivity factor required for the ubiquitination activity of the anaphase promoting complex (APC) [Kazachstania saulgeensis]